MILALTDSQLEKLTDAAVVVSVERRDAFLRAVAARLDGEVDDGDLLLAINETLLNGLDVPIAVAS